KDNQKQIGLYNVTNQVFYPTAKLKTQASRPFFYGQDGILENYLAEVEEHQASLLKKIIDSNYLPARQTKEHVELIFLLLLTEFRNPVSSDSINESVDNLAQILLSKSTEFKDDVGKYKISFSNPIGLSISGIEKGIETCADLHYKIIINKSTTPFITSDNPLIKYNQFTEINKYPLGSTGFGNIGFQMFFPINPWKMLIVYDHWCYKVGSSKKIVIETKETRDVDQLNLAHFLNCNDTLFFNHSMTKNNIIALHQKSLRFEKAHSVITKELPEIGQDGKVKKNSSFIMSHSTECKIKLDLTFIKLTDNAKYYKMDKSTVLIRPYCRVLMGADKYNVRRAFQQSYP
ncbi:MAG TPA: DUF4238 domain-containing protein, partial [Bacteroidia bacterium]